MADLAPLRLSPRLDVRLWGGDRLGPWLGLTDAPAQLAEAWLVYGDNVIADGPFAGRPLKAACEAWGAALLGRRTHARHGAAFPLLAKLIDARDRLSVQVHPNDAQARAFEASTGFSGKTEAWHILEADPEADVFLGFDRAVGREELRARALDGSIEQVLRRVKVHAGQTLFVPAQTVHGINGGTLLFEIQQTSDLTYRLYDYGRTDANGKPRELHLDRAVEVTRLDPGAPEGERSAAASPWSTVLVECPYFRLERWDVEDRISAATDGETFEIVVPVRGEVTVSTRDGDLALGRGVAVVLPAELGDYTLTGKGAQVLRSTVPA